MTNTNRYYKPQIMTAQKVEKLTQTRRAEEEVVKNLLRYNNESQRLINAIKNENQMEQHCHTECSRREDAARIKKDEEEVLRKKRVADREKDEEFKKMQQQQELEKERIQREIQRICESSEELKKLEETIKIAYLNKERSAQHQESLLMKKIDYAREELIEQHMEEQRHTAIQREDLKDSMRRESLVSQKMQLQEQMRMESEVC
jgi:hypothetical protein